MAPSLLDKQTAGCNSPHDWLMSFAMDLVALFDMWREKWHQWMHLAVFSIDVAFAHRFVATHPSPPSHPVRILMVLAMTVKKLPKMTGNLASYLPNS